MLKKDTVDIKLRLCTSCFNCKKKRNEIYCKFGKWREIDNGRTILHTPYDFNCYNWED